MKHRLKFAVFVAVAFGFASCDTQKVSTDLTPTPPAETAFKDGELIPGQYIVVLKGKVRNVDNFIADNLPAKTEQPPLYVYDGQSSFQGFTMQLSPSEVSALSSNPNVKYVEQDKFVVLNDPKIEVMAGKPGGGGGSTPQTTPWGISVVGGIGNGVGKRVCVIDTGINMTHPDLTVDASKSVSYMSGGDSTPEDNNGHGSHVSGTIAAKNDANGVVGVAAGATLVAVKVLGRNGSGTTSGVIAGVNYVGSGVPNCGVANMSLGGGVSQALDDAALAAANNGIKFALAAGNESADANTSSPGRVNHANIYTIAAVGQATSAGVFPFASFSNYSLSIVDKAEPGVGIPSTYKGGGYATLSGTSMASPHAAGILVMGGFVSNAGTTTRVPGETYNVGKWN
jgi:subtilisin family serine protease